MANSSTATASNGVGKFPDALAGFAAEVVKLPAGPAPDPDVTVACALGWTVGQAQMLTEHHTVAHLARIPGIKDATAREEIDILVNEIISRCGQLGKHLKDSGAALDLDSTCKKLHITDKILKGARGQAVLDALHEEISVVLWSAEKLLGQAYQLGYELEQMCDTPLATADLPTPVAEDPVKSLKEHIGIVHACLSALATKLPANAAHATENSLRLWWAVLVTDGQSGQATPEDLWDQGQKWHAVLTGDVTGRDMLHLSDYMAAAGSVSRELRQAAQQVIARFAVWLLAAFLIAGLGTYLMYRGSAGGVGAGIVTVVAAFGVTWKGIGEFFGRAAAQAEDHLWDAELDWAIAHRFTVLTIPDGMSYSKLAQPTRTHVRRHRRWKRKWPDVEFLDTARPDPPDASGQAPVPAP
jgi:hypothetical protein